MAYLGMSALTRDVVARLTGDNQRPALVLEFGRVGYVQLELAEAEQLAGELAAAVPALRARIDAEGQQASLDV